jgi:hypothetical protein
MALGRLWDAPRSLLREVGATIGADVPFFLSGGTALGLGRGEEIYPSSISRPLRRDRPPAVRRLYGKPIPGATRTARRASARTGSFSSCRCRGQSAAQMVNDLEPPSCAPERSPV